MGVVGVVGVIGVRVEDMWLWLGISVVGHVEGGISLAEVDCSGVDTGWFDTQADHT